MNLSNKSLLLIAFLSGACSMGIEIAASRVLAPVFGTSIYVWGALIGVLLGAMSIGYFLGGYIIDKNPNKRVLFDVLFLSSILTAFAMFTHTGITVIMSLFGLLGGYAILIGPILSSIILFSPSMLLLAMVPPIVIRLSAKDIDNIGKYSGTVYMISTIGSIIGTFLTAFFMIPTFGTRITFISISILLFLISIISIPRKIYLFFILIIILVFIIPQAKPLNVLYSTESEYNVVRVLDSDGSRILMLNTYTRAHSVFYPNKTLTGDYWDYYNVGLFFNNPKKALFLGAAGGTSIRQFLKYSNVTIDAVEIDSKVVYVAEKYFNINESDRLHIYVEDGRMFLVDNKDKYDIISIDVFSGGPDIPFHMTTMEFFQLANERLTNNGMVIMNVPSEKDYMKITNSIANTMLTTFESVYIIDLGFNQIVIGFKQNMSDYEFSSTLQNIKGDLEIVANNSLYKFRKFEPTNDIIFTDDISPVERMTFEMISQSGIY